jgi:type I restriction enzyme S subunit
VPLHTNGVGRVRLDTIADLQSGYAQRVPAADGSSSPWRILLGRHAIEDGRIDWSELPPCEPSRAIERFALQDGDVLLTTRTTNLRAIVARDVPPRTIASAQFAMLRPRPDLVDARYLAWFLNRADARSRLRTLFKGSTIPFLPVTDLASFEVQLPPIEHQRAVARVNELRGRERELRLKLDHAFEVLMDAASQRHSSKRRP